MKLSFGIGVAGEHRPARGYRAAGRLSSAADSLDAQEVWWTCRGSGNALGTAKTNRSTDGDAIAPVVPRPNVKTSKQGGLHA